MSIYFCGGSCIEDVTTHLMTHLSLHPTLRTCSSDTILRAIKELTQENISYTSDTGKNYDFNTADTLIRNFHKAIIQILDVKRFGLKDTSLIKAFVFRFISVPAKWIRTSKRYVLNINTCNNAYADIFQTDFG